MKIKKNYKPNANDKGKENNAIFFKPGQVYEKTRRLKSFPWDALVHGSIMAFYLNLEKLGKPERCVML